MALFVSPSLVAPWTPQRGHDLRSQKHTMCVGELSIALQQLHNVAAHARVVAPPHSGSHFVRCVRRGSVPFFEGWYLRAVIPETGDSFAFMFSVESNLSGGLGTVQVAGPDDVVHYHELSNGLCGFRASPTDLNFLHWGVASPSAGQPRPLNCSQFVKHVQAGYQLDMARCAGIIPSVASTRRWCDTVEWDFRYSALLGWGNRDAGGRCTATNLSHLPMFEPGYQILMAHGVAESGTVRYGDTTYNMRGARVYAEKNWGASFPSRWWWIQSNAFDGHPDLSVTALGATRKVLGRTETLGMIAVHFNGVLYEFANWNSVMEWQVAWGKWEASCSTKEGSLVSCTAHTTDEGVMVRGPSVNGMQHNVRDAMRGSLALTLRDKNGNLVLDNATCGTAQVEVGGEPWNQGQYWSVSVPMVPQPIRAAINLING